MIYKFIQVKILKQFLFAPIPLSAVLFFATFPVEAMVVKCMKGEMSNIESCDLKIYPATLSGNSGNVVRVNFLDGTKIESFCIDEQSKRCLVRSNPDRKWEIGRIDWINRAGFRSAFWIKKSNGQTLAIYDAPLDQF
jgi:hypothetical protein